MKKQPSKRLPAPAETLEVMPDGTALTEEQHLELSIVAALNEVSRCLVNAQWRAFEGGLMLTRLKELTPHGEWLPKLEHIGVSQRTAHRYMTLASEVIDACPKLQQLGKLPKMGNLEDSRQISQNG